MRVTRSEAITRRDDEGEEEEEEKHKTEGDAIKSEDVEMAETSKPKTTRKKKEKKVIPVGKNGLKKRKVMKTRKEIKDGYMGRPCLINGRHDTNNNTVTEDYSDWESVNEEDMEATLDPPKRKGKGIAKASKIAKKEPEEEEDNLAATAGLSEESQQETAAPTKSTVKPPAKSSKRTSKGGQKSLANFFGPPKAKKI